MVADEDILLVLAEALETEGAEYALIGAVALGLHGLVRATEDIDIFIRPTRDNVASVKCALRRVWDDESIDEINPDELCGAYPVVRYGPPCGNLTVDVVSRLGSATSWDDLEIVTLEIEGTLIRVVSAHTLYLMKRDTVRPKDQNDAQALRRAFGFEDE